MSYIGCRYIKCERTNIETIAFIDYGFAFIEESSWSWRGPLLLQCVFAAILAIGCFLLPESPRFLVSKERNENAVNVLARLHGKDENDKEVQLEYQEIVNAVDYERTLGQTSWREMFTTYRRRSFIAIMVQALGQLSGSKSFTSLYMWICILISCFQSKHRNLLCPPNVCCRPW